MPSSGIKAYMPIEHSYIKSIFFKKEIGLNGNSKRMSRLLFWMSKVSQHTGKRTLLKNAVPFPEHTHIPNHRTYALYSLTSWGSEKQQTVTQQASQPECKLDGPFTFLQRHEAVTYRLQIRAWAAQCVCRQWSSKATDRRCWQFSRMRRLIKRCLQKMV